MLKIVEGEKILTTSFVTLGIERLEEIEAVSRRFLPQHFCESLVQFFGTRDSHRLTHKVNRVQRRLEQLVELADDRLEFDESRSAVNAVDDDANRGEIRHGEATTRDDHLDVVGIYETPIAQSNVGEAGVMTLEAEENFTSSRLGRFEDDDDATVTLRKKKFVRIPKQSAFYNTLSILPR